MPAKTLDLSAADGSILIPEKIVNVSKLSPADLSLSPRRDDYIELRGAIARHYDVTEDLISLGNGSDELIEMIASIYGGGTTISLMPAFERLYEVNRKYNSKSELFMLEEKDDYRYTYDKHIELVYRIKEINPRIVWLCSPNNPTGEIISLDQIAALAEACSKGVIVVDEAFIDLTDAQSAQSLIKAHSNVITINSFSKTWGLSALRVGFAIASKQITEEINTSTIMFNINKSAVVLALQCLMNNEYRKQEFAAIHKNRTLLLNELKKNTDITVISHSPINVICVKHNHQNLHELLIDRGIKTKSLSKMYGMEKSGFCRILVPREQADLKNLIVVFNAIYS